MGSHHGMLGFGESHGSGQSNGGLQHHPGVHERWLVWPCWGPLAVFIFVLASLLCFPEAKLVDVLVPRICTEKWQTFRHIIEKVLQFEFFGGQKVQKERLEKRFGGSIPCGSWKRFSYPSVLNLFRLIYTHFQGFSINY